MQVDRLFCSEGGIDQAQATGIDIGTKRRYVSALKRQSEIERIKTHSDKLRQWAGTVQGGGMSTSEVEDAWNYVAWDVGVVDGVLMDTSTQRALLSNHITQQAAKLSRWCFET